MNNTQKFSGKAKVYSAARPSYPNELYDYLKKEYTFGAGTVVADIASGTGKFTEPLLKMGCLVYAVEPNEDMRRQAENSLGEYDNFISVNSSAENTGLPDHSVDYISAAQAFHWFDPQLFTAECKRLLKPKGKVFILYNSRDKNAPVTSCLEDVCKRLCPDFKGFSGGVSNNDKDLVDFFKGTYALKTFKNDLYYNRDSFIKRMLSSSYSPREWNANYTAFVSELNALFDKFAENDILLVPNNTYLYVGTL